MDVDFAIADWLAKTLDASTGNCIWINKAGVHARYHLKYPAHAAIWTPIDDVINSYDNAIRYNVNGFFRRLDITRRRPHHAALYVRSRAVAARAGRDARD